MAWKGLQVHVKGLSQPWGCSTTGLPGRLIKGPVVTFTLPRNTFFVSQLFLAEGIVGQEQGGRHISKIQPVCPGHCREPGGRPPFEPPPPSPTQDHFLKLLGIPGTDTLSCRFILTFCDVCLHAWGCFSCFETLSGDQVLDSFQREEISVVLQAELLKGLVFPVITFYERRKV